MAVIAVDDEIVQRILVAVPRQRAGLAQGLLRDLLHQRHHMRVRLVVLGQRFAGGLLFPSRNLGIVELPIPLLELVEIWRVATIQESRQDLLQHVLVGGQVCDDVFDRSHVAYTPSYPFRLGQTIDRLQHRLMTIP